MFSISFFLRKEKNKNLPPPGSLFFFPSLKAENKRIAAFPPVLSQYIDQAGARAKVCKKRTVLYA